MKDENNGKIMTDFVGLRAKLYAFKTQGENDTKRAKGVKSCTLKTITFDDFVDCSMHHKNVSREQRLIRSKKHKVCTITQNKLALSWEDDKRCLIQGQTDTVPWGYINNCN